MTEHLAVAADAVAVGTAVNVDVAVSVEVLDGPPVDDAADLDHVVEAGIRCSSGRMVVMGCTDFEPDGRRISVPAGGLRVRVSQSNLDRAVRAGIDSAEDPLRMERLRLQVWPAALSSVVVVKRWQSPE